MTDVVRDPIMEKIFTQGCHHLGLSVMFITQNLFVQGKSARTISLNTTYVVLFKNIRDQLQIRYFARQLFPNKVDQFLSIYEKVLGEQFQPEPIL